MWAKSLLKSNGGVNPLGRGSISRSSDWEGRVPERTEANHREHNKTLGKALPGRQGGVNPVQTGSVVHASRA